MDGIYKKEIFLEELKHWFKRDKRIFPWRINPSPYAVWVSEVMLQQTRASVVIPYFNKWMSHFPTVASLANASLEEVIKIWEGLGYYSRARSLHEGAQYLVKHHQGKLPSDPKLLKNIKGIGPYTMGAILSFAFHRKAVAMDGNAMRVMARLHCFEEEIDHSSAQKFLQEKIRENLPDTEPWVIMEALIELGATLCQKKPQCEKCPLQDSCLGYLKGKAALIPKRKKREETIFLKRVVFVIYHKREFLIQKHEGKKVMAGLHEFPYFSQETCFYPGKLKKKKILKQVDHTFTRYKARLFPTLWEAEEKKEVEGFFWTTAEKLDTLSFSSGHRKIFKEIRDADFTY